MLNLAVVLTLEEFLTEDDIGPLRAYTPRGYQSGGVPFISNREFPIRFANGLSCGTLQQGN